MFAEALETRLTVLLDVFIDKWQAAKGKNGLRAVTLLCIGPAAALVLWLLCLLLNWCGGFIDIETWGGTALALMMIAADLLLRRVCPVLAGALSLGAFGYTVPAGKQNRKWLLLILPCLTELAAAVALFLQCR